ncbi:MAG: glutathione-disulfide reductase [Pseudomonadota bacterium]
MADDAYDLFVIGAGSGGVRAARIAAQHGAKVAIAEEYRYGGTCVIRGCVPKKLFVYASSFKGAFEDARGFGWSVGEPSFDWPTLIANKDEEIARLEQAYLSNLEKAGVEHFRQRAVFRDPHTVELLGDNRLIRAKHILIATGGTANTHEGLPGVEHAITSNEAFHLETLPKSIIIAGGGYIAVEFAGIFAGLGVETTLLYRRDKVLRGFDEDMRDALTRSYQAKGINIHTNAVFNRIEKRDDGTLRATLSDDTHYEVDQVMFAIGRSPNTRDLGLEHTGVKLGPKGEVIVDAFSRTNVEHIYAVGDVTARVELTPVAIREGHAVADNLFGGQQRTLAYDWIPTAVFSNPEIGTVGLTEDEARERCGAITVYRSTFRPMKYTLPKREERMVMKLIIEDKTDRVMGCHIFGPDAAEIVQMAAIAIKMGATKADFDATMALHPSAAEELVTMR